MTQPTEQEPSSVADQIIRKSVTIHAPAAKVWVALTEPALMQRWMAESEIHLPPSGLLLAGSAHYVAQAG